jgi:hypothetical protein
MNLIKFNKRKFLIKYNHHEDFGHEWYVQILNIRRWSLLQMSISWNDYPSWPYLQLTLGSNGFFGLLFWVYKFGFDMDFISRTWNFDRLDELDEIAD